MPKKADRFYLLFIVSLLLSHSQRYFNSEKKNSRLNRQKNVVREKIEQKIENEKLLRRALGKY